LRVRSGIAREVADSGDHSPPRGSRQHVLSRWQLRNGCGYSQPRRSCPRIPRDC
jgi:hypothetical protein